MKRLTEIDSNLDKNFLKQNPQTSEPKPTIPNASTESLKNRLKMDFDLNISTQKNLPSVSGAVGKIVFHSMKSSGTESNLIEVINNTDGNKSFILIHPTGSFEIFDNDGNHILKSVGDQIIVGKSVTIEAEGEVSILSNSETTPLDEIVTVTKLKAYLASISTPIVSGSQGNSLFVDAPLADIGTTKIKVGKS